MPDDTHAGPDAYPRFDLHRLAAGWGVDLDAAFAQLQALYDEVEARNRANTAGLNLPCHRGCSMCCHQSVFLTPLEFFYAWDHAQTHLSAAERQQIVARGLALYRQHRARIDLFDQPPPHGQPDHWTTAKDLAFACPMLSSEGACRVYPARELLARLFGCSFQSPGSLYACHWVDAHLAGKTVTLMQARPTARRLQGLPLTAKRQVYPYYFQLLYGSTEYSG